MHTSYIKYNKIKKTEEITGERYDFVRHYIHLMLPTNINASANKLSKKQQSEKINQRKWIKQLNKVLRQTLLSRLLFTKLIYDHMRAMDSNLKDNQVVYTFEEKKIFGIVTRCYNTIVLLIQRFSKEFKQKKNPSHHYQFFLFCIFNSVFS